MALDPVSALVDLPTAKTFLLATTGSADDMAIENAINAASLACENYCNRLFRERTVNERVEGPEQSLRLYLNAVPLKATASVSVTVDGIVQTVWRVEGDGAQSNFDVIARADHLYRRRGWCPSTEPYNVLLAYTGGYSLVTVPAPVKEACLYVVQKLFRDAKRQFAEITQVNTPMGGVTILDNAMSRMARLLLDPYRFIPVA